MEEKKIRWICEVCGWVYDPAVGDPDGGERRDLNPRPPGPQPGALTN